MDGRLGLLVASLWAASCAQTALAAERLEAREWYRAVTTVSEGDDWLRTARVSMPPPPSSPRTDINIAVGCVITYDPAGGLYTYSYTVANSSHSNGWLETFGFLPMKYQTGIASPTHWWGFDRWQEELDSVVWTVVDNVGSVSPDTLTPPQIPRSPYCVPPGGAISGFAIVSRQPPGEVTWYAQAYDTLASDEADPSSALLPVDNTFFRLSVTGTVEGPDLQSVVGVGTPNDGVPGLDLRWLGQIPSSQQGEFEYRVQQGGRVSLRVFDIQGRRVADLVDGHRPAGLHRVTWSNTGSGSGVRIASGVYFARLKDGQGHRRVVRVIINK